MISLPLLLIAVLGCILQAVFITVEHKEKYVPAVILKGSASFVFCFLGVIAFLNADAHYLPIAIMIVAGLVLGAVGDILLNLRFVFQNASQKIFLAGIAAFLIGHIAYMVSLILVSKSILICTVCGVLVAAVLLTIIFKSFELKTAFKIFGVLYIGAVCLMASYAIGNAITYNYVRTCLLYAIGAVLFLISDVVLIFNTFGSTQRFGLRITNLSLYYIGQLLIAFSLYYLF